MTGSARQWGVRGTVWLALANEAYEGSIKIGTSIGPDYDEESYSELIGYLSVDPVEFSGVRVYYSAGS